MSGTDIIAQTGAESQEKNSGLINNARLKLVALALSTAVSSTSVQANDLLQQCDFNKNGIIDTKKDYKAGLVPLEIAKKESRCNLNYDIIKGEEANKKGEEEIKKGEEEIKKGEEEIKKGEEEIKKIEKEHLERKKKKIKELQDMVK